MARIIDYRLFKIYNQVSFKKTIKKEIVNENKYLG